MSKSKICEKKIDGGREHTWCLSKNTSLEVWNRVTLTLWLWCSYDETRFMLFWGEIISAFHLDIGLKKWNLIRSVLYNLIITKSSVDLTLALNLKEDLITTKKKNIPCVLHSIQKHKQHVITHCNLVNQAGDSRQLERKDRQVQQDGWMVPEDNNSPASGPQFPPLSPELNEQLHHSPRKCLPEGHLSACFCLDLQTCRWCSKCSILPSVLRACCLLLHHLGDSS